MEEIKSVRVRDKNGVDIKVTLYRDVSKRKIEGKSSGVSTWGMSEYGGSRYQDYTDDQIIDDFIEINRKSKQITDTNFYSIIQDPWSDKPPLFRSFGFDPYYLNNGGKIFIKWYENDFQVGGKAWSDENGNELNIKSGLTQSTKSYIIKSINFISDTESLEINKNGEISKYEFNGKSYTGLISDIDIINEFITLWKLKVPNYNLELCNPSNEFCNLIKYKSPLGEFKEDPLPPSPTEESVQGDETRVKLTIVLPDNLQIKVKEDLNGVKVYAGDPPPPGGFIFQDNFDNLDELDPEYLETAFDGLSEEEYNYQEEISKQEDSLSNEGTPVPEKVDIIPVGTFDELLRLAGKLARELGKNARVKYENLRQGYISGVHGLCPQGTQAVLAALTGVKELGRITGNADWFSFKSPGTGGGNASFSKTGYFNDKVKITQINGSWKGTYIQDKSKWQVGDVVAMGYKGGKPYGHIQVWTGYYWMSDFKQNQIQQNNVDPNTVALWRLNEKGLEAVRKQSKSSIA